MMLDEIVVGATGSWVRGVLDVAKFETLHLKVVVFVTLLYFIDWTWRLSWRSS